MITRRHGSTITWTARVGRASGNPEKLTLFDVSVVNRSARGETGSSIEISAVHGDYSAALNHVTLAGGVRVNGDGLVVKAASARCDLGGTAIQLNGPVSGQVVIGRSNVGKQGH